jgi:hypothetical protein
MAKVLSRFEIDLQLVIAGLDPAIHPSSLSLLRRMMDARVKPGHDDGVSAGQFAT